VDIDHVNEVRTPYSLTVGRFGGHARIVGGVIAGLGATLTIAGWAAPGLRERLGHQPGLAWALAVAFAVATASGILVEERRLSASRHERGTAQTELEATRAELAALRAATVQPTRRDCAMFGELEALFPWGRGFMGHLEFSFNAKQWTGTQVDPLYHFVDGWNERFFDDETVHLSYREFRQACEALCTWFTTEGAPTTFRPDSGNTYSIAGGGERDGGWPAFDQARALAETLVAMVTATRRDLERVARLRGL
jgi:hypothetical protein